MTDGREIVRTLEQELDATQQRCAQLERAIVSMRDIWGITGEVGDEDVDAAPARATTRQTAARVSTSAASAGTALGDRERKILAVLKAHAGSMKPGDLQRNMKAPSLATLRYWIKPLLKTKQVIATGTTASRRFSLPGRVPKEGP